MKFVYKVASKKLLIFGLSVFLFCTNPFQSHAQVDTSSINNIIGENYFFSLRKPQDWICDKGSAKLQELVAVWYSKKSNWSDCNVGFYTNVLNLKEHPQITLDSLLLNDIASVRYEFPNTKIKQEKIFVQNKPNIMIEYLGGSYQNYDAVVFIRGDEMAVVLGMTAKTQQDFDNAIAQFKAFVASFELISEKVVIKKN